MAVRSRRPFASAALAATTLACSAAYTQASPLAAQVAFAPPAEAKFDQYGKSEEGVLQGRILSAVARACQATLPAGVTIDVLVLDVAPTYPTRAQLDGTPSLDPVKTHYLGGADLTGYLRNGQGQVLATVKHRYFPPTVQWRSYQYDPWSDADRAIDQFADELGSACRAAHS
jgi:hypothetical protein